MDSAPPPATPLTDPPAYVYGPSDIYPLASTGPSGSRSREEELCGKADHPDWLYLGGLLALDVGAIYVATGPLKYATAPEVRGIGPALIGFTWGATITGSYLAMPKCDPHWVSYPPREGDVRDRLPLALTLALVSAVTAPIIMAVATGPQPDNWTTQERMARLFVAGGSALVGAVVPYLLPPKTYRAARELERIRIGADAHGAFGSYTIRF